MRNDYSFGDAASPSGASREKKKEKSLEVDLRLSKNLQFEWTPSSNQSDPGVRKKKK